MDISLSSAEYNILGQICQRRKDPFRAQCLETNVSRVAVKSTAFSRQRSLGMIYSDPEWSGWDGEAAGTKVEDGSTELHGNGGCHGSIPCWAMRFRNTRDGRVQAKDVDGPDSTWRALRGWQDVSKLSPKLGWATLNFCFNQWPHISSLARARTQRWDHSCLRKFMCLLGQIGGHVIAMLHNDYFYRLGWNVAWRSKEEAGPIPRRCSLNYSLEKSMFSKWMAVECYLSVQSELHLQEAESELGRCGWESVMLAWYWRAWAGTCDGGRRAEHEFSLRI